MSLTKTGNSDSSSPLKVDWKAFRHEMPVCENWSYLDHAAVGALPRPAVQAMTEWMTQAAESGDYHWLEWADRIECLRGRCAELIGAQPGEISIVPNTTFGIATVAEGFPWNDGDNVVIPGGEFPSNIYPWMHLESRGVELRTVPLEDGQISLTAIDSACDRRTRIVAMSWIGYSSGFRVDVARAAEIAHRHGALFFLDAIQGLGVFPIDVHSAGVDFLAADGHKWLLGPEGIGLAFVSNQHRELLRPLSVGWRSVAQGVNFSRVEMNLHPTAARFEMGTLNTVGCIGFDASLQLLMRFGLSAGGSAIAGRVLEISQYLSERLTDCGIPVHSDRAAPVASGIVSFTVPGVDPENLRTRLLEGGVILSCRGGKLRAAIHGFNNRSDIDRLVEIVGSHCG